MELDTGGKHAAAPMRWVVGITGASGAVYGVRLVEELLRARVQVQLVVTDSGWRVLKEELGWNASKRTEALELAFGDALSEGRLRLYPNGDIGANIASGSYRVQGMAIVPCSMGTLSAVAHGSSDNLMTRAADVMMKEGRKLILMPRETPMHAVHLENMLKLSRMGVSIVPAMPAFYYGPRTMEDLVDFLVGKLMDVMGLEHDLFRRWGDDDNGSQRTD
ncbi:MULTISPECIES: UbiX family flavin prenyltransferase [Paenibacillus]|uniref:UbiX family flavin prenyltransferase n=1 Tax=Paenibacillus TaxID=44249 RepID=UPI00038F7EBA|nr:MULTISPECIES: flavin prenyltransferase UbiX [Paenibacillus]